MNFLKDLSTRYYKNAKQLNYTWMDLVKKTTREKVIDDVRLAKNIKIMNKAEEDTITRRLAACTQAVVIMRSTSFIAIEP